jgi:uncharacterized protein
LVKITVILGAVLVASLFGNYILYQNAQTLSQDITRLSKQIDSFQKQTVQIQQQMDSLSTQKEQLEKLKARLEAKPSTLPSTTPSSKSITAVAVRPVLQSDGFFQDVSYQGTVMSITVSIRDGTGLVLVNTETPTGVDFQTSAKTAVKVAQEYTGANLANKDIIFSITAKNSEELQAVDGPSAGMAMTVLLVKEIHGEAIDDHVLLTGTIEPNGKIGSVGGVAEKAEAAAKYGAKTFVVPVGQAITHVQSCKETKEGLFIYRSCTLEQKPLSPIMEEKYGMKVVEATDLASVLKYFG